VTAQIEFALHPEDEAALLEPLFRAPHARLVRGPRWPTPSPPLVQELAAEEHVYLLVWPTTWAPELSAQHIPTTGDWYCNSEFATLQLIRSRLHGSVLTSGRLALSGFPTGFPEEFQSSLKTLFGKARRTLKRECRNGLVCWHNPTDPRPPVDATRSANPSAPDKRLWLGPHAIAWLQQSQDNVIKLSPSALVVGRLASGAGPNNSCMDSPVNR